MGTREEETIMAIIIINVGVTEVEMVATDMIQTVLMTLEGNTVVVVQTGAGVVQAIITTEVTMIDIIKMIGMVDRTEEEEGMTLGDTEIVIMMIHEVEVPVRERQVTMRDRKELKKD